jgi:hypothetical protein
MRLIVRATAVATMIAMTFHGSLPALASTATLQGTVETPCDPSRVGDVVAVQMRPVSGGSVATAVVDPSTGKFVIADLTAGEYELLAIGADGQPLSPETKRLTLVDGPNPVVLSLQPPGCGEQVSDGDGGKKAGGGAALETWQLTLIYVGVVGAVILALDALDDDEDPASPF